MTSDRGRADWVMDLVIASICNVATVSFVSKILHPYDTMTAVIAVLSGAVVHLIVTGVLERR